MSSGYYYLSLPYEGSPHEQSHRESVSLNTALDFLDHVIYLFSPVTYISALIKEMDSPSLQKRRDLLMPYMLQFLKESRGLILLKMEGWQKSWGVHQELLFCRDHHIPVFVMEEECGNTDMAAIIRTAVPSDQLTSLISEGEA